MHSENILTRYKASSSVAFGGRLPFTSWTFKEPPTWHPSVGSGVGRLQVVEVAKSKQELLPEKKCQEPQEGPMLTAAGLTLTGKF